MGHAYIVHAPLLYGATTIAYEGAPDHPGPETFYKVIQENHVTGMFTSPTLVRLLMRYGADVARDFDLSSVERVFCAGEVLNAPAWEWLQKEVFKDEVPVIDHMWATETGGPIIGNPYGIGLLPIKPGSGGISLPGIEAAVLTPEGQPCAANEKGLFVVKRPFPGLISMLWGEPDRYGPDYWQRIPNANVYCTGDAASIDEDGYVWFSGRADEVIKIAAHRIGTIEVETAFLQHPAVAEVGVTGRPEELRGEVIAAFVVLKQGHEPSEQLRQGADPDGAQGARPGGGHRRPELRGDASQDTQRQDHAPRSQGGGRRQGPGRHLHYRGRRLGGGGVRSFPPDEGTGGRAGDRIEAAGRSAFWTAPRWERVACGNL